MSQSLSDKILTMHLLFPRDDGRQDMLREMAKEADALDARGFERGVREAAGLFCPYCREGKVPVTGLDGDLIHPDEFWCRAGKILALLPGEADEKAPRPAPLPAQEERTK